MQLELVSIPTDTEALDGILWQPDGPVRAGVLLFHGNTNNFYSGPSRWVAPRLVQEGFACLAFNRRGHDILTTLEGKRLGGGALQTAAEGIADNDLAASFLAERRFGPLAVVGHSNGGMLGAQFAVDHPELRALVLMSAHAGGPETYRVACANESMAGEQGDELLDRARQLVAEGHGDQLLLMDHWWNVISAESLVDRHERTPDLLRNARSIHCPSLFVVGDKESTEIYPAEAFAAAAAGPSEVRVIEGGNHFYTGLREPVADIVAEWLVKVFDQG